MTKLPSVTVNNIREIGFLEMIEGLEPYVLEEIPEGTEGDEESLRLIDTLLGRFANLYTYLVLLYSVAADHANRARVLGADEEYKSLVRKKDALYELSRGVKLKWQACSRMLTKHIEEDDEPYERANYKARSTKKEQRAMKGWSDVT